MKLTEQDKSLFKRLHKSEMGAQLSDYLTRLQNDMCDARTWKEGDTAEVATKACEKLQYVIDRIQLQNTEKQVNPNQYT